MKTNLDTIMVLYKWSMVSASKALEMKAKTQAENSTDKNITESEDKILDKVENSTDVVLWKDELHALYKEKFWKDVPIAYVNKLEWIKSKLS